MTQTLVTRQTLINDVRALGVRQGSVLILHSSLSSLGWVCGGPVAVIESIMDVLGPAGTLVVATHTPENSDPRDWSNPPVPADWWPVIRDQMPGFDPAITPSRWMGAIAETVRTWPGARRSDHPHVSFAALGAQAETVVSGHRLDEMLGESSPLGQVYRLDGDVLLLGVGHDSNTSLHLAEYRVAGMPRKRHGASVRVPGGDSRWIWWDDVDVDEGDFDELGAAFDASGPVASGLIGGASAKLMRQRLLVDFAVDWMGRHRGVDTHDSRDVLDPRDI